MGHLYHGYVSHNQRVWYETARPPAGVMDGQGYHQP